MPNTGQIMTGWVLRPFQRFFALESASGLLLLFAAVVALVWANSPLAASYFALWDTTVAVRAGALVIEKPLLLWVNDGLMAIFFFVVGLEIKREVMHGELAEPKKAALSVAAAIGGMMVPAIIYMMLNAGGPGAPGWAIPMATDIAFALGVIALLGSRVPLALRIFVTAVAIVDDLGAVLMIALFYTDGLSGPALGLAALFLAGAIVLNITGVRKTTPYAVIGVALWVALLKSGVHATVAGVLLALTIPARQLIDAPAFLERARALISDFAQDVRQGRAGPTPGQRDTVHELGLVAYDLDAPLTHLEHSLHPWVAFGVMPIFALANAGVALSGDAGAMFGSPITLGVILGLFLGKPIGILLAAWVTSKAGLAALPEGVSWGQIVGVSLLCGIGFTMSLFIAGLAFVDGASLDAAKVGILTGSLVSGITGALVLARARK